MTAAPALFDARIGETGSGHACTSLSCKRLKFVLWHPCTSDGLAYQAVAPSSCINGQGYCSKHVERVLVLV
jgi:hypothetical protein